MIWPFVDVQIRQMGIYPWVHLPSYIFSQKSARSLINPKFIALTDLSLESDLETSYALSAGKTVLCRALFPWKITS